MNLCRSALYGVGTNTMFETGYFDDSGNVVSNFGQPNDTKFVIGSRIYNGQIYNCDRVFKLLNFCEQSSIDDIRVYNVNQAIYANRCFYSRYNRLMTRAPLDGTKYPAYHFDDAVNAIEVCQLYCTQFNVGWKISGSKDNFRGINCGSEGNGVAVQIDGACNGMLFDGWYFENNSSAAFVFNSDGNHSNIDIRNCYFNTTSIAISGSTIVSGIWHRTNRVGDAILQLSTNFSNQLHVEVPTDDSAGNAVSALPSNYQLGDAITVDYVKTIYGTDGLTAAKAKVAGGIIPLTYAGDTGKAQSGVIPFCISMLTDTTLTVDSQISFRDGAPVFVQFNIIASGVQQIVGIYGAGNSLCLNKPAEIGIAASNNAGFYRFTITGLVAATDYSGVVRLLS